MTTEWWDTRPAQQESRIPYNDPPPERPLPPAPVRTPELPEEGEEEQEGVGRVAPDRRKGILLSAAGAAVAGIVLFGAMPDGDSRPSPAPQGSVASSPEVLLPAAGDGPEEAPQGALEPSGSQGPKTVTLTATPDGSGGVGALVMLTVVNSTDETVVIVPSMVKGDGRPALLGEGTLAPGSRSVNPGETVSGTVEFAAKAAPSQVVLMDIGGNVVAASG